ncbi:transmembrane protein 200C [Bombina bombina]|uniref:transmembrane protein 200C n=1 Tax=Bombina bombina TaxID=8345 RepID=UPI00235AEF52|nr:transmembrane protein 200C [Bombina bombina]
MIATGGLLRISARKQDPLHPKSQVPKKKRKAKKKRKNDVVVVKGKLKLCSISGLIALCGILVLLVGIAMAVIGYWPKSNSVYNGGLGTKQAKYLTGDINVISANKNQSQIKNNLRASQTDFVQSNSNFTRSLHKKKSSGFLAGLFSGYLHSDNLKVFGPLIMGIGIFLFICANAVLHENRDKKTKIINLRDLYSTVIDVHGLKCKDGAPLNGFVNCVQSRSMDMKVGDTFGAAMLAKSSWHSALGGPISFSPPNLREIRTSSPKLYRQPTEPPSISEAVYSIYRERSASAIPFDRVSGREGDKDPLSLSPDLGWDRSSAGSIVGSSLSAFTLPIVKLDSCLLEKKPEPMLERKGAKEDSRGEIEMSLTNLSHADLNWEISRNHRKILLRRQSTSCLPDLRKPMLHGPLSELGSQSLSSTDLDCSLLMRCSSSGKTKPVDCLKTSPLIRKYSQSSESDQSSNKGYIHLDEAGTSFDSIDNSTNKTQDCEEDAQDIDIQNSLEGTSKEKSLKSHQKIYTNKEKLMMLSMSHVSLDDNDVDNTSI